MGEKDAFSEELFKALLLQMFTLGEGLVNSKDNAKQNFGSWFINWEHFLLKLELFKEWGEDGGIQKFGLQFDKLDMYLTFTSLTGLLKH